MSQVAAWPMYLNDQLGDCTIAAAGHIIEAWTHYGEGTTVEIKNLDVLNAYEAVSGYILCKPETDQGANMQDVCQYSTTTGIGGHKLDAFAEVNYRDDAELKAAPYLFGHIHRLQHTLMHDRRALSERSTHMGTGTCTLETCEQSTSRPLRS